MPLPLPYFIDAPDVRGNFDEIAKQFPVNEGGLGTYKQYYRAQGQTPAAAFGTYVISPTGFFVASGGAGTAIAVFWFDPADFNWAPRTTRLKLRLTMATNAVAPAVNFTLNMNTITAITGAAGVAPGITAGAAPAGAAVTINAPIASATTVATSVDFVAPAASQYCLTVVVSGAMAANSLAACVGELLLRQT